MKRITLVVVLLAAVLLVACGGAAAEPTVAVATVIVVATPTPEPEPTDTPVPSPTPTPRPTDTPEPTLTPTVVPLSDIDLEPLLMQDGDLPPHLVPDFVYDTLTTRRDKLGDLARPEQLITQEFYSPEKERTGGAVIIFVYETADEAENAYGRASVNMPGLLGVGLSYRDDIGEGKVKIEAPGGDQTYMIFTRCSAFVFVWMIDVREFDLVNYGQRLDERLAPVVCRDEQP